MNSDSHSLWYTDSMVVLCQLWMEHNVTGMQNAPFRNLRKCTASHMLRMEFM